MGNINRKRHKLLKYIHENGKDWKKKDMGISMKKIKADLKLNDPKEWALIISQLIDDKELIYRESPNKLYKGIALTVPGISAYSNGKYKRKIQWWNIVNTFIAISALIFSISQYYYGEK